MTEGGINIKRIDELLDMTEELRKCLGELIDEKGDLLDREVIVASQMLDSVLNQYHQVISKKKMDK